MKVAKCVFNKNEEPEKHAVVSHEEIHSIIQHYFALNNEGKDIGLKEAVDRVQRRIAASDHRLLEVRCQIRANLAPLCSLLQGLQFPAQ